MATREQLLKHFNEMESERQEVLRELTAYSDDLLSTKPSADVWSVAEVIEHLTVAETGALNYMRKKIQYGGHRRSAFTSGLKQRLLNLAISLPIRYKVPKMLEKPATSAIGFQDALKCWDEVRADMCTEYETMDGNIIGNELFKHPTAGKMNVIQGVRFMRRHMNRHIGQIHRTISSLK